MSGRDDLRRFWALLASIDEVRSGWENDAACQGIDPALFYPEPGEETAEAVAVCEGCVVQAECLTVALERNERFGIWGGAPHRQRRLLRAARRADRDRGAAA